MKKIVILLSIVFICSICFCGCSNNSNNNAVITSEPSNPFDLEKIKESGSDVMASYGWWISNYDIEKRCIEYDNSELKLDITFDNGDTECETGLVVFIDGIAQKYSMSNNKNSNQEYIIPITLEADKESTYSISFEPQFGIDGTEHEMYIAAMYNPSYRADEGQGFGNYQQILPGLPWKVLTHKNSDYKKVAIINNSTELSDEIKDKYIKNNSDGIVKNTLENMNVCKFLQDNKEISLNTIDIS